MEIEKIFLSRIEERDGCLIWTGASHPQGYGKLHYIAGDSPKPRLGYAHRYAWERKNGPIPAGMKIDHTCWNPACVNVDHLRLATRSENGSNRAKLYVPTNSGVRGVHRHGKGWRVEFRKNQAKHRFGTYRSLEEAIDVANRARHELFGEFAGSDG